jgi:hypothetical protein
VAHAADRAGADRNRLGARGEGTVRDTGVEVAREAGTSPARERHRGVIGGAVGAIYGLGSAVIVVYIEGASWWSRGPYPAFFATRRLLAFDLYLGSALVTGVGFLVAALALARVSRYPRTDASGALVLGLVLGLTSGAIPFARLLAVVRGG